MDTDSSQEGGCSYLITLPGILKILEMVVCLTAMLLVSIGFYGWVISWFIIISIVGMVWSFVYLMFFILKKPPKPKAMFSMFVLMVVFYIIGVILVFVNSGDYTQPKIGAGFGIIAALLYAIDVFFIYKRYFSS